MRAFGEGGMARMKQLPWHEAIEQVLRDNGGVASLEVLYRDIAQYRDLTTNREWKATLRGILYREMQRKGQIVRVGLGFSPCAIPFTNAPSFNASPKAKRFAPNA